ncbi:hypothetical protein H6P81_002654 [Aristolochia fimbriata]|uniref:Reverse transcriptase domain-containing protein n=1 Tax=Aristolochia fimbriata TaxID=158543 RepID=A0AAV7FE77_ARIFI|nr:hypothetical protein H6P81_002654 [Aristolochia fimbriata]
MQLEPGKLINSEDTKGGRDHEKIRQTQKFSRRPKIPNHHPNLREQQAFLPLSRKSTCREPIGIPNFPSSFGEIQNSSRSWLQSSNGRFQQQQQQGRYQDPICWSQLVVGTEHDRSVGHLPSPSAHTNRCCCQPNQRDPPIPNPYDRSFKANHQICHGISAYTARCPNSAAGKPSSDQPYNFSNKGPSLEELFGCPDIPATSQSSGQPGRKPSKELYRDKEAEAIIPSPRPTTPTGASLAPSPSSPTSPVIRVSAMMTQTQTVEEQLAEIQTAMRERDEQLRERELQRDLQIATILQKFELIADRLGASSQPRNEEGQAGPSTSANPVPPSPIIRPSSVHENPPVNQEPLLEEPGALSYSTLQEMISNAVEQSGDGNPKQHVAHFIETCNNARTDGDFLVKQFGRSLKGNAFDWFIELPAESIDSWEQLESEFLSRFYSTKRTVTLVELTNLKQRQGEKVIEYINRWRNLSLNCKESTSLSTRTSIDIVESRGTSKNWRPSAQHGDPHPEKGEGKAPPTEGGQEAETRKKEYKTPSKEALATNIARTAKDFGRHKIRVTKAAVIGSQTPIDSPIFATRQKFTLKDRQAKTYPFPTPMFQACSSNSWKRIICSFFRSQDAGRCWEELRSQLLQVPSTGRPSYRKCFVLKDRILKLAAQGRIILESDDNTAASHTIFVPTRFQHRIESQRIEQKKSSPWRTSGPKPRPATKDKEGWEVVTHKRNRSRTPRENIHQGVRDEKKKSQEGKPERKEEEEGTDNLSITNTVHDDLDLPIRSRQALIKFVAAKDDWHAEVEQLRMRRNDEPKIGLSPSTLKEEQAAEPPQIKEVHSTSISFKETDMLLGEKSHNRPLFVSRAIKDRWINRILLDSGSAVNILPIRTLKNVGLVANDLQASSLMIQGFNQEGQRALGTIKLELLIGDMTSHVLFHVIDARTSYNVLLGRPWLHNNRVVPSTLHQCFKYYQDGEEKTVLPPKSRSPKAVKGEMAKPKKQTEEPILRHVPQSRRKKGESPFATCNREELAEKLKALKGAATIPLPKLNNRGILVEEKNPPELPKTRTQGFDPNAYRMMAKAGFGLSLEQLQEKSMVAVQNLSPTQKSLQAQGYSIPPNRHGLGYQKHKPIVISGKASVNQITIKRKAATSEETRTSAFDRIGVPEPRVSAFVRLGQEENKVQMFLRTKIKSESKISHPKVIYVIVKEKGPEEEEEVVAVHHISADEGNDSTPEDDPGEAPTIFEEGAQATIDQPKKVNLDILRDAWARPNNRNSQTGHQIRVKPIKQSQRRFRPELVPEIEKEVDKLLKADFIREVKYPSWIANIVPVKKKNGQIRVCVDFRDLNKACPKDDFPLPITELMVDVTTGHEALSFMDGSSGYNQIRMDPKDEEKTAFRTPKGIFCYKVMPFGMKNAGATYQRAMQKIFDDFLHKFVECYVDDVVVKTKSRDDHLKDLRAVFERLRRYQLKMNPLKCAFGVSSGKFLGFVVRHRGIEIDQNKIDAIQQMPEPKTLSELKSLQGHLAYIRRFISNLAGRCQPFSHLMKKDTPFEWGRILPTGIPKHQNYLMKPPVLMARLEKRSSYTSCSRKISGCPPAPKMMTKGKNVRCTI